MRYLGKSLPGISEIGRASLYLKNQLLKKNYKLEVISGF